MAYLGGRPGQPKDPETAEVFCFCGSLRRGPHGSCLGGPFVQKSLQLPLSGGINFWSAHFPSPVGASTTMIRIVVNVSSNLLAKSA
jgi:hypothetical protein